MKAKPDKAKKKAPKASRPAKVTSKRAAKTAKPRKPARRVPETRAPRAPLPAEVKPAAPAAAPAPRPSRAPSPISAERRSALIATRRRQFQHHRELLLERQRELMEAYTVTRGDSRGNLDDGTEDYIDYAVHSYAREFLLSLTELDRKQLLLVEEALRRIDRGEYGRCMQCAEEIHPRRLEAAPWARYCVRCQELEERGLLPQLAAGSEHELGEEPEEGAEEAGHPEEEVLDGDLGTEEEEEVLEEEGLPVTPDDEEE